MTRTLKPTELDYLPTRNGGADQLHTHLSFGFQESCGACAQLKNDFLWAGFHDSVASQRSEFGTVEDAMKYAEVNIAERETDPRARAA